MPFPVLLHKNTLSTDMLKPAGHCLLDLQCLFVFLFAQCFFTKTCFFYCKKFSARYPLYKFTSRCFLCFSIFLHTQLYLRILSRFETNPGSRPFSVGRTDLACSFRIRCMLPDVQKTYGAVRFHRCLRTCLWRNHFLPLLCFLFFPQKTFRQKYRFKNAGDTFCRYRTVSSVCSAYRKQDTVEYSAEH